MNSTSLLLEDIRNELAKAFTGFRLLKPAPGGLKVDADREEAYCEPNIFIGSLPSRQGQKPIPLRSRGQAEPFEVDDELRHVPFIMLKVIDSVITGEAPRVKTVGCAAVFTVFVGDDNREAGMVELLNVGDRIVEVFCLNRFWGDSHWQQQLPIRMVQGTGRAEDIYASGLQGRGPYYGGAVTTQFIAAASAQRSKRGTVDAH